MAGEQQQPVVHKPELLQVGTGGAVRAVCSCGLYSSIPTTDRQRAYRMADAHARYYRRKEK